MSDEGYVYRPLGMSDDELAAHAALAEGVPPWLKESLAGWLRSALAAIDDLTGFDRGPSTALLRMIERELRLSFDWSRGESSAFASVVGLADSDSTLFLRVVDHRLHDIRVYDWRSRALLADIDAYLTQGGSAWAVGVKVDGEEHERVHGLERRMPEPVAQSAREAMGRGKAGEHLRRAWNAVYGIDPNPSYGYGQAIKAVEVAAAGVVGEDKALATLGTRLGDFIGSEEAYTVVLQGAGSSTTGAVHRWDTSNVRIARLMMQLLWTSQDDRHGDPDPDRPISVSQPEGEAAVHLAVLLVQWLHSGAIVRR